MAILSKCLFLSEIRCISNLIMSYISDTNKWSSFKYKRSRNRRSPRKTRQTGINFQLVLQGGKNLKLASMASFLASNTLVFSTCFSSLLRSCHQEHPSKFEKLHQSILSSNNVHLTYTCHFPRHHHIHQAAQFFHASLSTHFSSYLKNHRDHRKTHL
jgi:hypothetical protein